MRKKGFIGLYKLKKEIDICGYYRVGLYKNGKHTHKRVNRLVAEAFIPNPENKPIVNHIDYDRKNDDVSNLEWCTQKENVIHSANKGRYAKNRGRSIFSLDKLGNIKEYPSGAAASRETGVFTSGISRALKSKSRKAGKYFWFITEKEARTWKK